MKKFKTRDIAACLALGWILLLFAFLMFGGTGGLAVAYTVGFLAAGSLMLFLGHSGNNTARLRGAVACAFCAVTVGGLIVPVIGADALTVTGTSSFSYVDYLTISAETERNTGGNEVEVNGDTISITSVGYTDPSCSDNKETNTVTVTIENHGDAKLTFTVALTGDAKGDSGTIELAGGASKQYTVTSDKGSSSSKSGTVKISGLSEAVSAAVDTQFLAPAFGGSYTVSHSGTNDGANLTVPGTYNNNNAVPYILTAVPEEGYVFVGWKKGDGTIISTQIEAQYRSAMAGSIQPVFRHADSAQYSAGGGFYYNFDEAIAAAQNSSNKKIVVIQSGNVYHSDNTTTDFVIPNGIQLLVPFSSGDDGSFEAAPRDNYVSESDLCGYYNDGDVANFTYCTLTVPTGSTITCYGEINVNGQRQKDGQPYSGVNGGNHGRMILGQEQATFSNSDESALVPQLIIAKAEGANTGGKLYCYGYITGTGMVEVRNGAEIHENLQICDWPGGSNAADWPSESKQGKNIFALTQYYIQNVEAPLCFNHGATGYITGVMTASRLTYPLSTAYVGNESGLFRMGDSADRGGVSSFVRIYDHTNDRVNYHLHGDISLGSIKIDVADVDMDSSDYILPIGSTLSLIVEEGTMTMDKKIAILPGAQVHIKEGATVSGSGECYVVSSGGWSSAHIFHRGSMSLNEGEKMDRTSPQYAPLPYIATRNGLGPNVSEIVRGYTSSTQRYYTDVKSNPASGKLIVDGLLEIKDGGALATTYSRKAYNDPTINGMTSNVGITGSGTIKFEGTNKQGVVTGREGGPDYGIWAGYSTSYLMPTTYAKGKLAGVASSVATSVADSQKTERSFLSGTYYGLGTDHGLGSTTYDNYWYNYTISVPEGSASGITGTTSAPKLWLNYATVGNTENVVGLVANSATYDFSMPVVNGSGLSISGGGDTLSAVPTLSSDKTKVSYTLSGLSADVVLGTTTANPTTVNYIANNAKPAVLSSLQIVFPAKADLKNFKGDGNLSAAATSANIGKNVYLDGGEAVAALSIETRNGDADPVKGSYTRAFMKVSEAVAAATGDETYVTVLKDRTLTDKIVVATGQNITLDLGGKTLNGGSDTSKEPLTNNGTLRLINGTISYGAKATSSAAAATVRNKGTIEYIENVTLLHTNKDSQHYAHVLKNETGATIKEFRSGEIRTPGQSIGYPIYNAGTINTIGTSGNTVTLYGRRGIEMASTGIIGVVGGTESTVDITAGQYGIEVVSGSSITTIADVGSTLKFNTGEFGMNKHGIYVAGTVTTIGAEGSVINIKIAPQDDHGYSSYGIRIAGKVSTIGAAGSTITIEGHSAQTAIKEGQNNYMFAIYNTGTIEHLGSAASGKYSASDLRIDVSHSGVKGNLAGIYNTGTIKNLGAAGAVIYVKSNYTGTTSNCYGYGIFNDGTITNAVDPKARIELVCNQMPLRTGSKQVTVDGMTLIYTGSGGYYPLHNTSTSVAMLVNGGNFYALSRDAISKNPSMVTYKSGYSLSTTTRNVTLVDGTTYPCYYLAKSGAGTVTGEEPGGSSAPTNQGILGDVIAEYLAMTDNSDTYVVLTQDCPEYTSIVLTGDVYLDLNGYTANLDGFDLNGYNLYVIDSATNAYLAGEDTAGSIIGTVTDSSEMPGAVATVHTADRGASEGKHYVQVPGENGAMEFHRVGVSVTAYRFYLNKGDAAVTVEGTFRGTEAGLQVLSNMGFVVAEESVLNPNALAKNEAYDNKESKYLHAYYSFQADAIDTQYNVAAQLLFNGGSATSADRVISVKDGLNRFYYTADSEDPAVMEQINAMKKIIESAYGTYLDESYKQA